MTARDEGRAAGRLRGVLRALGGPLGGAEGAEGRGGGRAAGGARRALVAASACVAFLGCTETPTGAVLQIIEEVEFDASLGIDLAEFTQLQTGVYYKDIVVGTGTQAIYGSTPTVTFTTWIADGTEVAGGSLSFLMGNFRIPLGMEEGIFLMRVGGRRMIIVPPERGLGGIDQVHQRGTVVVPAGSVLVYEVVVDEVSEP